MYQTTTESGEKVNLSFKNDKLLFNNETFAWEIDKTGAHTFLIRKNNKTYRAEVLEIDYAMKIVNLKIDKRIFEISLKDKMDLLLEQMGISSLNTAQVSNVKAPMPGLILDILIEIGQEVKKGDKLLILEAMKMENVLKSPGDGTITSIEVTTGDSVEKNQVLINF